VLSRSCTRVDLTPLIAKLQPGHGLRFIRKDGQPLHFISSKAKLM